MLSNPSRFPVVKAAWVRHRTVRLIVGSAQTRPVANRTSFKCNYQCREEIGLRVAHHAAELAFSRRSGSPMEKVQRRQSRPTIDRELGYV
jgi:hypothetical protein